MKHPSMWEAIAALQTPFTQPCVLQVEQYDPHEQYGFRVEWNIEAIVSSMDDANGATFFTDLTDSMSAASGFTMAFHVVSYKGKHSTYFLGGIVAFLRSTGEVEYAYSCDFNPNRRMYLRYI